MSNANMLSHVEFLDDRILAGLLQLLAFTTIILLLSGISGTILTFVARLIANIDAYRILRIGILLPLHISIPLCLLYAIDEMNVHDDAPDHIINNIYDTLPGKEMHEKQEIFLNQHRDEALIFFISCLIILSISIYLLKYWKLKAKRRKK